MYFLSEDERRLLTGKLLPHARRHEVHGELRGWSWRDPPLSPPYDVRLGAAEITGKYCETGRDIYLRRVLGVGPEANRAMRFGASLHRTLVDCVLGAKRLIYAQGPDAALTALEGLIGVEVEDPALRALGVEDAAVLRKQTLALRTFECRRIIGRVQDVLARQPRVGVDSLVGLALPVTVEQQLDGTFLGLSAHLSTDALTAFEPVVFDVKFDRRRDFHRLAATAYAMVLESLYEHPVDVGCVVYARFDGERVLLERDLHLIDDELRQWFIEERDERTRMVAEEIEPGRPEKCPEDCPYSHKCRRA